MANPDDAPILDFDPARDQFHFVPQAALAAAPFPGEGGKLQVEFLGPGVELLHQRGFFFVEGFLAKCFGQLFAQRFHQVVHGLS